MKVTHIAQSVSDKEETTLHIKQQQGKSGLLAYVNVPI
jgi:hypothetical protein